MKSNRRESSVPLSFTAAISTKDFPNPYLPLPSEQVLETLLQKAGCIGPLNHRPEKFSSDAAEVVRMSGSLRPGDVSNQPPRPLQSSTLRIPYANVETFGKIRSWLILHQPPPGIDGRDDIDAQILQVTNSIQLLASALLLHRCWLHVVEDEEVSPKTSSTSSDVQNVFFGTRNIISDVIRAIQATLPFLVHNVSSRDDMRKGVDGEPYNKKRKRRRSTFTELSSIEWLDPHLVDWSLRSAMDQFLFPVSNEALSNLVFSSPKGDVIKDRNSASYRRYEHFVWTFRQSSWNEVLTLKADDDGETRDNAGNMVSSLVQLLKEIRTVVQQSIEAYNGFRSIFCAVFDSPESLSSIPWQQQIRLFLAQNSPGEMCIRNIGESYSDTIYQQQKWLLELGWKLSLHARFTLPPHLTEYCRAHSFFSSAVSISCIAKLLIDCCGKLEAEKCVQSPTSHIQVSSDASSFNSVLDVILKMVNNIEYRALSRIVASDSQSSLEEEEEVPNGIITKQELKDAAFALMQSFSSEVEILEESSNFASIDASSVYGSAQLQPQALDDVSKKEIVSSFASVIRALSDLSCSKVSTVPYNYYVDQTAMPVNCFADALGCTCTDADCVIDDSASDLKEQVHQTFSPHFCDKLWSASSSLYIDKLSQATAVLATVEKVKRHALRCYATPIVITDDLELTEWAMSTFLVKDVHPSTQLLTLLDEYTASCIGVKRCWQDIVYPIINKGLRRFSQGCDKTDTADEAPVAVLSTGSSSGYVRMRSEITADMQLCKAMVALYYHALEAILCCDKAKSGNQSITLKKDVLLESFHQSLLACCCLCITKANAYVQRLRVSTFMKHLPMTSILSIAGSGPYEFLKLSCRFLQSLSVSSVARGTLGSPLIFPIPALLRYDIERVEINIIDSLLWLRNNSLPSGKSFTDKILAYQKKMADYEHESADAMPCLWPPNVLASTLPEELEDAGVTTYIAPTYPKPDHPEYDEFCAVLKVVRKLLLSTRNRLIALCQQLQVHVQSPILAQVWVTFRHLLRNHVELFFDRHIDQWILCSLYGVSRSVKYQPELKFAKIIEAYVAVREEELGPIMCQRIVRHIRITAPTATDEGMGNIISLYNKVFVPKMKEYLLNSESLRRCTMTLSTMQQKKNSTNHGDS